MLYVLLKLLLYIKNIYRVRTVGFYGCSPRVKSSWCRERCDHITRVSTCLMTWHRRLRIWALLSVIRGLANAALPLVLDLWTSTSGIVCGNRVFKMNIQFCCPVTYAAVIMWFFETILRKAGRSLSVNVDFRSLLLFADVVFPWFVYVNIALETVALDTPSNMAGFLTDAPAKRAPTVCSFKIGQVSHFPVPSHGLSLNTITNALTRALQSVNKRKKSVQGCQLKFFQCSEH
jgi:hypothetical protein